MDILTHALSGTAIATCTSAFIETKPLNKVKILLAGTFGGILPDLDAISLWSGFNPLFGKLFNLPNTGREIYGMKFWYSHHAFMHSVLASILFGLLLVGFLYQIEKTRNKERAKPVFTNQFSLVCSITFIFGYWAHLAGDLPTPSSVWGGIALFWPSTMYIGGSGKIWWWNNYDIFLLILGCALLNLALPAVSKFIRHKGKIIPFLILGLTFFLIIRQTNTREFDYAYEGDTPHYTEMEENSKKEQERILGKRLYQYMSWFDSKLKFYF